MSENRLEILDAWFACAWLGAILVPINTATKGPQLQHVLSNAEPRALAIEPAYLDRFEALDHAPSRPQAALVLDHARRERLARPPRASLPRSRHPRRATPGSRRRDGHDPLHLGHDRPLERRRCAPSAQFYWWARLHRRTARRNQRRRRALYLPAALSLQRIERLHAGTGARSPVRRRTAILRVPVLGPSRCGRRDRDLPPRSNGLDPCEDRPPSPAENQHRLRIALSPATPGHLHELFRERFISCSETVSA